MFKNVLLKNGIDLMFVIDIILNKVDVFINLIRDENNEDSYFWIMLLFVFECGNNVWCMLNVGS